MLTWRPKWLSPPPEHGLDSAQAIATLSALHQAGLSVTSAWAEVAALGGAEGVPHEIHRAIILGDNPNDAIAAVTLGGSEPWRALGACWAIARITGAPLAPALSSLVEALRDSARTTRQVNAALAGPRATMRLVLVLPLVGMIGGGLGGQDTLGFLVTTPLGGGLLVAGAIMMALAWWWLRAVAHRALPAPGELSLELDLFAIASRGGALPEAARRVVRDNLRDFGLAVPERSTLDSLVALSRRAGVPVASLAEASAALARDTARTAAEERLQRLGVAVVLPLGLLVLPAFVMLAIVPMALGLWAEAVQ